MAFSANRRSHIGHARTGNTEMDHILSRLDLAFLILRGVPSEEPGGKKPGPADGPSREDHEDDPRKVCGGELLKIVSESGEKLPLQACGLHLPSACVSWFSVK